MKESYAFVEKSPITPNIGYKREMQHMYVVDPSTIRANYQSIGIWNHLAMGPQANNCHKNKNKNKKRRKYSNKYEFIFACSYCKFSKPYSYIAVPIK